MQPVSACAAAFRLSQVPVMIADCANLGGVIHADMTPKLPLLPSQGYVQTQGKAWVREGTGSSQEQCNFLQCLIV